MYIQVVRRLAIHLCDRGPSGLLFLHRHQQLNINVLQPLLQSHCIPLNHNQRTHPFSTMSPVDPQRSVSPIAAKVVTTASATAAVVEATPLQIDMRDATTTGEAKLLRFDNLLKSQQDNRDYRGLQLPNGLKALLVSDPATDKAAAALTVGVGHMSDPEHLPGLAHFCEHMLFLGTSKYPDENAYSTFLAEHGGHSNASTYADNTKYYFDVVPGQLAGALDRFAQFFVAPLFTESMTEREINAVHSEHEKNLATDAWRIRQVNKSLSDPGHPYCRFGTGSKQTLSERPAADGVNVRDELIRFHGRWYSANIMCLAVYGRETLDELEALVVDKFAGIVDKAVEVPTWPSHPFLAEHRGTNLSVVPVKDSRGLTIAFPTGDLEQYYKSGPERYISHLMGHEGAGSLLSELKQRGWCNSLMAGHSTAARGFGFFEVTVDLTQDGLAHVDDIVTVVFQYLRLLRAESPMRWIFDEYRHLSEMEFRFKDKETPITLVSGAVQSMQLFPINEVLSAPYLITEWRPELIVDLLQLLRPDQCRVTVIAQSLEPLCTEAEQWYGTKYQLEKLDAKRLCGWLECETNEALKFPTPNPFIPTDFALAAQEPDAIRPPQILSDSAAMRVWHKQDTEFLKPKTILYVDLASPLAYLDPLNCNLTHMFVQLLRDQLNEYLYDAELAGLGLDLSNTASGINLTISGYSHKQSVLLKKVLEHLFKFDFDSCRFEIYKEKLARSLKNYQADQPYQHAIYYLALILTEHAWTKQELTDAVELVTETRLRQFVNDFLARMHCECFVHGNADRGRAAELTALVEQQLRGTSSMQLPLLSRQLLLKREYKLCAGERYLFETQNEYHKSSCAELFIQCGQQSDRANVFIDLVAKVLNEPCYNQLRTKEQLGYIVFCGPRRANSVQGIRFIVQSTRHPAAVEERIECFLDGMQEQIANMPADEFQRHKDALAAQKLENPKRLGVQSRRYFNEIVLQTYHFGRAEAEVAILRTVTQQELLDFFALHILRSGAARNSLSVHIISTADGGVGQSLTKKKTKATKDTKSADDENSVKVDDAAAAETTGGVQQQPPIMISDLAVFKASKGLYPLAQPHIDIQPKGARSKL